MRHNAFKSVSLFAAVVGLGALFYQPARAQAPLAGPLRIGGNTTPPASLPGNGNGLLLGSSAGYQWLQSYGGPLILNGNGGGLQLVGIGRTDPAWTLDVAGTIRGDSSASAYNFVAAGVIGKSAAGIGVEGFSDNGAGVYGMGVTGVAARGQQYGLRAACTGQGFAGFFLGNVMVNGNVTYTGTLARASDARYKANVQTLGSALQTVENLRGVTYDYKRRAFPERNFPAGRQVGFLAQEVQSVLPQLVSKDRDGYLSVDYVQVVPVLVEAIKEQQKQIEALKQESRRVHILETQLAALAAQITHAKKIAQK